MRYTSNIISFKSIKEMPVNERPREKLALAGGKGLSDLELICSILGRGCKGRPVQEIALDVLDRIKNNSDNLTMDRLSDIEGLGTAKKAELCAALELGRRLMPPHNNFIKDTNDVFKYLAHYGDRPQEHFVCLLLNGAMELMGSRVITVGLVNRTLVHPREVFAYAIENRATSLIIAHNHPSGNLMPSTEDLEVTYSLKKAGDLLGIQLLDHLIFSDCEYRSLKESGEFYFT